MGAENAEKQTNISSLCLVVAPLVSLMKNQVAGLRSRGTTAAIIGPESTAAELKDIISDSADLTLCLEVLRLY